MIDAVRAGVAAGLLLVGSAGIAGEVEIVAAEVSSVGNGRFSAQVTLLHADSGWDHYADAWRLALDDGTVLGTRTLLHPHDNEQPFTRGLGSVVIADDVTEIFVEAHDSVHGWSGQRLRVELSR